MPCLAAGIRERRLTLTQMEAELGVLTEQASASSSALLRKHATDDVGQMHKRVTRMLYLVDYKYNRAL